MEYKSVDVSGRTIRYMEVEGNSTQILVPVEDIAFGSGHYISSFPLTFRFSDRPEAETYVKVCRFLCRGRPDGEGRETAIYQDVTPEYLTVGEFNRQAARRPTERAWSN